MKKALVLILMFIPCLCFAITKLTLYKPTYPIQYKTHIINKNTKIIDSAEHVVNKDDFYTTTIHTPILIIQTNPKISKEINTTIETRIKEIKQDFLRDVGPPNNLKKIAEHGPKLDTQSNTLNVDYQVLNTSNNIISIRFIVSSSYYGAAHPNSYFVTMNFNLKDGSQLKLANLFTNTNYLETLSKYSFKSLKKQIFKATPNQPKALKKSNIAMIKQGIKPKLTNFHNWNITKDGLLINFNAYQVAAYVYGPQYVLIPYSVLKPDLKAGVLQ